MAINTELPIKTLLIDGQEIPIVAGSPKFAELIDGTITSLETSDLADVTMIRDGAFEGVTTITRAVIPSNVISVGESAFAGCSNLNTLVLEDGLQTIGANAFNGINASVIELPSTLTSVGESAFANNTVLSEVTIPSSFSVLPEGLFSGCTSLINVTMEATTPPSVTDTTFPSSASIYVKYGAYDDYVAQWSAYASQIVRLPAIPSTITITVNNYLGELVSGASVTITGSNGETYAGTTDGMGVFTQGDLQPATYTITVADIDGFKTPNASEVVVLENTQNSVMVTYLEKPAVNPIFGENTPAQIEMVSAEISAKNMTAEQVEATYGWKIGDTKEVTMSDGKPLVVFISDFNHDVLTSDHVTKVGITLEMRDVWYEADVYNNSNYNDGGYNSSMLKKRVKYKINYINNAFDGLIKEVDKVSSNGGGTNYTGTITTSEQIFPLSLVELTGDTSAAGGELEGYQYAYWKGKSQESYKKNMISGVSAQPYWLRSVAKDTTTQAYRVGNYNGQPVVVNASGTYTYASFAFCI